MELTLKAIGKLASGLVSKPEDPVTWFHVEHLGKTFSILGFNVRKPQAHEHWRIHGRKDVYNTRDEALAVLQQEETELSVF
jgi:hypothetical protein